MLFLEWSTPPITIIQAYEARRTGRNDIGALILWATWTVEGLHYLDELDKLHRQKYSASATHPPDIVNIAHARWATSSAITALDLCAAALGRECCGWTGGRELDLRDFDPANKNKNVPLRRADLATVAIEWVDRVLSDQRYKDVQGARNPFMHSRLIRKLYASDPRHTEFVVAATGNVLSGQELLCLARDLATERVGEFLEVVVSLT